MKDLFEILLYGDEIAPVGTIYQISEREARRVVEEKLRTRFKNCYNATISSKDPTCWLCAYRIDGHDGLEEVIVFTCDPIAYSRSQAQRLRVRGPDGTLMMEAGQADHRRGQDRRIRERRRGSILIGLGLWVASILLLTMMPFLVKLNILHQRAERGFAELQTLYAVEGAVDFAISELNTTGIIGPPPFGTDVVLGPVLPGLRRFLVAGATIPFIAGRPVRKIVRVVLEHFVIDGGFPKWKVISWQEIRGTS